MADQKPIIMTICENKNAEGDCACPDPKIMWIESDNPREQDCACPDSGLVASRPIRPGLWRCPPDLFRRSLDSEHEIVFAPGTAGRAAVLNTPARRVLDLFALPRRLPEAQAVLPELDSVDVERLAYEMAAHGLICSDERVTAECCALPRTLTAWLHVTCRCNLHCTYCYAAKDEQEMDEATGQAAVEAVFQAAARHGFLAVKLKYAGGEPSLNFSLVQALHKQAQALAGRHGLAVREVLLSNGVGLSRLMLVALRGMGMQLAISLDGIGPVHEMQRGVGTFTATAQTIDQAIGLGLRPHVSITVTNRNAKWLRDVTAYVIERGLPFNLNFYRDHAGAWRGADMRAQDDDLIEGMRAAIVLLEDRLPDVECAAALLDRTTLAAPHTRPCGTDQSYVAIDTQGNIARCHMEMDKPVGTIWHDDPVAAVRGASGEWHNLEVDAKRECRVCAWRYYCAGGCPLLTYRLTKRDDGPSPYCRVYRTLLPEVLRLEGLRLLKQISPIS